MVLTEVKADLEECSTDAPWICVDALVCNPDLTWRTVATMALEETTHSSTVRQTRAF